VPELRRSATVSGPVVARPILRAELDDVDPVLEVPDDVLERQHAMPRVDHDADLAAGLPEKRGSCSLSLTPK
jgi:hypothetical protein